ncbi:MULTISPECIES: HNH endonuclease [Azotobacter]|uniref:HNH endonuclease n=1 Tax=Azotobacter TaxID=352 RepID=UPI000681872A|nr:HNH endonuclease [Azotobacter vinelandii]SFX70333.1 HNH endonuclease [Azotobacter vinelandii]
MANLHADKKWAVFRARIIELDSGACLECGRTEADGVVLQVHHKHYIRGRKPWEYDPSDCETLCKGCHAREHGEIRPSTGLEYIGEDDLGDLFGTCELCDTAIRYVHHIQHPHWEPMGVGTDCCDNLTGTEEATKARKRLGRLRRFLTSSKWSEKGGRHTIQHKGYKAAIVAQAHFFRLEIDDVFGKQDHETLIEAKEFLFDFIDSGQAAEFFERWKARAKR